MKTIQTELGHTIGLVNRLGTKSPEDCFQIISLQSNSFSNFGKWRSARVFSDIYGIAMAKKMVPFKGENADYEVNGYVSLPEMTRASRNYITLMVNGRWMKSYVIDKTII